MLTLPRLVVSASLLAIFSVGSLSLAEELTLQQGLKNLKPIRAMTFTSKCNSTTWRFASVVAFALVITSALAQEPIKSIGEVRMLAPAKAAESLPVLLEAQVLRGDRDKRGVFIFDGADGIYLEQASGQKLFAEVAVGDVLQIKGATAPGGFLPTILAESVTVVGHKPLPLAPPLKPEEINDGGLDCSWRQIEGRLVEMVISKSLQSITFSLEMYGGLYKVHIPYRPEELDRLAKLKFSRVRFNAVLGTVFNEERQYTGRIFFASSADDLQPIGAPQIEGELLEIHELLRINSNQDRMVRTRGTVTHVGKREIFLRGSETSLRALYSGDAVVSRGDIVELTGIPYSLPIKPSFRAEEINKTASGPIPEPIPLTLDVPFHSRFHHELVSVEADLVDVGESFVTQGNGLGEGRVMRLLCRVEGQLFHAELQATNTSAISNWPRVGDRLRLVGICHLVLDDKVSWHVFAETFSLQIRDEHDIAVLVAAPWWTTKHLLWVSATLVVVLGLVSVWVVMLRRTVERQTAIITEKIERESILQERQRVARELHDHLDQGLTAAAVQLRSCRTFIDNYITRMLGLIGRSAELAKGKDDELAAQLHRSIEISEVDVEKSRKGLRAAQDMLSYCGAEARKAIWDLRGGLLEKMSLPEAVKETCSVLAAQFNGAVNIDVRGPVVRLTQAIERNLLLVAREAVTNAIRHSGASDIRVLLVYNQDQVELTIQDDGRGFEPELAAASGRFGLQGMRERCGQIGAQIRVQSSDKGTLIMVRAPKAMRKEEAT